MASTTPLDLVTKALSAIGTAPAGEAPDASMANDAFDLLNDMLDQWSNDRMLLYCVQEAILELTASQYIYTIGEGGMVGAVFAGTISGTTLTVTALTSGAISVGMTITGTGIATGTVITSLGTALGGNGANALGTYKVNTSQTVPASASSGAVASVSVVSPGAFFSAVPTVSFAGGGGTGAAASALLGISGNLGIGAAGLGYTAGDIVTLSGGTFTRAARLLVTSIGGGGTVGGLALVDAGSYSAIPANNVATTGGTGTGFTASVFWSVVGVTVTAGGSGYTSLPTVTIQAIASLSQATATAALGASAATSITITSYAVRPLRINSAFVRVVNSATGTQDFPVDVVNVEDYELIGIKTLPGPWPRAVYYQPSEPLGVLNFWPNPSSGEVHLFCDTVLTRFATLTDTIVFPPGYFMALMWNLADYLIPFYPATGNAMETRAKIPGFAKRGLDLIKRTNMAPQQTMRVDSAISARRGRDAGWILHGGFIR